MSAPPPRSILAVDRNQRNLQLLMETLARQGYCMLAAPDLAQLDAMLAGSRPIGLALVDVDGFDPEIWDRCRRLRDRNILVLVLAGPHGKASVQVESARCGARAVLPKPLSRQMLADVVRGLLQEVEA